MNLTSERGDAAGVNGACRITLAIAPDRSIGHQEARGSLIRLALTFVGDRGAAEDVVQDTWLGVIKGLRSFERRSSLKTWIFRILVNRGRTRGARDGRLVNFSAVGGPDESPSDLIDRFSAKGRWIYPPSKWQEANPEDSPNRLGHGPRTRPDA